jgi:hypothetical protein
MDREATNSEVKLAVLPAFIGLGAIVAASMILPLPGTDGRIAHLPTVCPFYTLTGLPCPLCGLTRAFVFLGHGQLRESLHWHPIGWLLYTLFVLFWLRAGVTLIRGKVFIPMSAPLNSRMTLGTAFGLLLVGIMRITWLTLHHITF